MIVAAGSLGRPLTIAPTLVGRARERTRLREALAAMLAGRGGLVLIHGALGIGKTALAKSLVREATDRGALALVGSCYDLTTIPAYGPWIDLLSHWPTTDKQHRPPLPAGESATPPRDQAILFVQIREFLTVAAREQPLVLMLDDLQWADVPSLDLLRFLARWLATVPVLIVGAYRDEAITRRHPLYSLLPTLAREADTLRLEVGALDDAAVRTLIWARYGLEPADEARVAAVLRERAAGNPLFIHELLRACEESGALRRVSGDHQQRAWTVGDLTHVALPPLLKQVLDGSVALLGPEAGRLLAIAATIGQEIPLALWATVAETTEEALLDLVERATDVHLLTETPDGAAVHFRHPIYREVLYEGQPATRRRIWHLRIGEALSNTWRTVAGANPAIVAEHFRRAGDPRAVQWLIWAGERGQQSYAWLAAATDFAAAAALLRLSGTDEAQRGWLLYRLATLQQYHAPQVGLAQLQEATRIASEINDRALLTLTTYRRAMLRLFQGQQSWGLTEMQESLTAWEGLPGSEFARLRTLQVGHGDQAPWGTLALHLALSGRYAEANTITERVLASTAPMPPQDRAEGLPWGDAHAARALIRQAAGLPDEARAAFLQAREVYRTAGHHLMVGIIAQRELAVVLHYATDDLTTRARLADEAEEAFSRASGVRTPLPPALGRLPLLVIEGRWTEAREVATALQGSTTGLDAFLTIEVGPLLQAQGDRLNAQQQIPHLLPAGPATPPGELVYGSALATIRLAIQLACTDGDLGLMRVWLETQDRWLSWGGQIANDAEAWLGWAQYHRLTGDLEQARSFGEAALGGALAPRQPLLLLATERFLGEVATAQQDFDAAGRRLASALSLADSCGAPYERALTLLALAELHHARLVATERVAAPGEREGKPTRHLDWHRAARATLDEARALCTGLGATTALARISTLSNQIATSGGMLPTQTLPTAPVSSTGTPAERAAPVIAPAAQGEASLRSQLALQGPPLDSLTAREVEVLRLIAAGMSNREIAGRLFLSVRTAERHIANIYKKIGAHNKADAMAFAFNRGLL